MPKNEIIKEAQTKLGEIMVSASKDIKDMLSPLLTPQEKHDRWMEKSQSQIAEEMKSDPEKTIKEIVRHMPRS